MTLAKFQALQPEQAFPFSKFLAKIVHRNDHRVAVVGPLPPKRCGLATSTADVQTSLQGIPGWHCDVVAIVDSVAEFDPATALYSIQQHEPNDYRLAAKRLNNAGVEVVSVQHEFGIFGGADGNYILDFMAALMCPCVVTLHTVLQNPTLGQRLVVAAILRLSASVIVMAEKGKELLVQIYGANPNQVHICPHGAPDFTQSPTDVFKKELELADYRVLLTFGLLSPGKGLETMIGAMPAVLASHPDALYVILGATHPHLIQRNGEAYRHSLIDQATKLGVIDSILFVDSFVDQPLLLKYLAAADIYVTPYLNEAQITSGTLAYAVAMGKPVVSTPFWHASEIIDETSGALVGFGDVDGFSHAITALLDDPEKLQQAGDVAYFRGRDTIWARSAQRYVAAFVAAIADAGDPVVAFPQAVANFAPRLDGVVRATDSCGIYQHSSYGVMNRAHGYCIDDNVRGLILVQRLRRIGDSCHRLDQLERTFAAFIQHAWNPNTNRFRNFMSYDRSWLEIEGSQDSNGRAYWALGETALFASDPQLAIWASEMAKQVGLAMGELTSLRARCFALLGARALLEVSPNDRMALDILTSCADNLMERLETHSQPSWNWFEPSLSYDNARPCEALITAGHFMGRPDWLAEGLKSLSWLNGVQKAPRGHFRAVGCQTACVPFAPPALFDQQPLEACASVDAAMAAYMATGHSKWVSMAKVAHAWFYGENDLGLSLCDGRGGCYDGLTGVGLNKNQGGESILALQMANATMMLKRLPEGTKILAPQKQDL